MSKIRIFSNWFKSPIIVVINLLIATCFYMIYVPIKCPESTMVNEPNKLFFFIFFCTLLYFLVIINITMFFLDIEQISNFKKKSAIAFKNIEFLIYLLIINYLIIYTICEISDYYKYLTTVQDSFDFLTAVILALFLFVFNMIFLFFPLLTKDIDRKDWIGFFLINLRMFSKNLLIYIPMMIAVIVLMGLLIYSYYFSLVWFLGIVSYLYYYYFCCLNKEGMFRFLNPEGNLESVNKNEEKEICRSRKIRASIYFIIMGLLIIYSVLIVKAFCSYTEFKSLAEFPPNYISARINENLLIPESSKEIKTLMQKYQIYRKNSNELVKKNKGVKIKDWNEICHIDEKITMIVSGPYEKSSGLNYVFSGTVFYPSYSNIIIVDTQKFTILKKMKIHGFINEAYLKGSSVYFQYDGKHLGRVEIQ